MDLRPDQDELTARARAAFRRTRRVCCQAQCGWGKTHFGCGIARRAHERGTRTLIVAHRRRLIQQWSDRLALTARCTTNCIPRVFRLL